MTKFQAGIFTILYIVWNYPAPDFLIAFWRQKCMDFRNIFVALYTVVVYRPCVIFYKMKPPRMVMLCSTYLGTSVCPSNVFAHDNSFCGGTTALHTTVETTD